MTKLQLCTYMGRTDDLSNYYKEVVKRFEDDVNIIEMYADFLLDQSNYEAEKMFSKVIDKQTLGVCGLVRFTRSCLG